MENLNAETVKKTLGVCSKQYKDDTCDKCPDCIYRNLGCDCVLQAITDALALINSQEQRIKELTEENERLSNRITCQVVLPDEKLEEIKNECLERVELDIKAIQADTVRKMQERTAEIIGELVELMFDDNMPNCIVPHCRKPDDIGCGHKICIYENKEMWLERLDQIAKEMLEGENERYIKMEY